MKPRARQRVARKTLTPYYRPYLFSNRLVNAGQCPATSGGSDYRFAGSEPFPEITPTLIFSGFRHPIAGVPL